MYCLSVLLDRRLHEGGEGGGSSSLMCTDLSPGPRRVPSTWQALRNSLFSDTQGAGSKAELNQWFFHGILLGRSLLGDSEA